MKKTQPLLMSLLAGWLVVAAAAPVAMRVEVEPLRQVGGDTEVAVVIQIAPTDRSRIGSNAIVRLELDGGRLSSGSPMRAVRAADDGSFRVVVVWPPGEHDLRVVIEDPQRDDTGLWVGTVRIPDLSPGQPDQEIDEPVSASASEATEPSAPQPVPAPELTKPATAVTEPEPEPETVDETPAQPVAAPEPTVEKAAPGTPAATAAAAAIPEGAPSIPSGEPKPVPEADITAESAVEPEMVEETRSEALESPVIEPETEMAEEELVEAAPIPEPETAEPALVEPLRAEPPPPATEGGAGEPAEPETPAPAAAPVADDLVARHEAWGRADPESLEFSLIAMRGREPALGVEADDLRLRIGGSEVAIERLGGPDDAPLLLGLAIDVAADASEGWSGMQGSLAPITDRAGDGRGRLFVDLPGRTGDWTVDPGSPGREAGQRPAVNLTRLVVGALARFEGQRGRTFLVVLTDGRNEPTKDEWAEATETAAAAGVPILVVALWDDEFSQRTRKNLKRLTEVSGGSLFLVQGRSQLGSAADRFGRYLDGGYAIRFRKPPGGQGGELSVSATDRSITISAPQSIR